MANREAAVAPLVVQSSSDVTWDDVADVVIVGFGGAGVVAAIQARECAASVIAIDRFEGGGATAYSGGVIYAGGTRFQRDSGYDDTPDEMYKYLDTEGSAVSPDTLRRFCEGSNADIEWLGMHGVRYGTNAFEEKTTFPPNDFWLYYSGNEKMPAFAEKAKPAPRGHRVAVNGFGGRAFFDALRATALNMGVRLLTHAPVMRLVIDFSGRVIGVQINALPQDLWRRHLALYKVVHPWRPFNGERTEQAIDAAATLEQGVQRFQMIHARRGVILSTGGFNHNRDMTARYRPALAPHYKMLLRLGSMGDDGSGVKLGESAGGVTAMMENISVARTLVPPNIFAHGIVVNQNGKRFVNEAAYAMDVGAAILEQPGGNAWLLLEARDFRTGVWKSFFPGGNFLIWGVPALLNIFFGGTRRAPTLDQLAAKICVDAQELRNTVEELNTIARDKRADPFGKARELIYPLSKGPYYAVNLCLDNPFAPAQSITMGGLMVDEQTGAVKRADGSSIEGLYAAGRVAVGLCSKGFVSGVSIADTVFSGRRAARSATR